MLSFEGPGSRKYAAPAFASKPAGDDTDVSPLKCAAWVTSSPTAQPACLRLQLRVRLERAPIKNGERLAHRGEGVPRVLGPAG